MEQPITEQYILELAEKWRLGTITTAEIAEYEKWYNSFQDSELTISTAFAKNESQLKERIFAQLSARIAVERTVAKIIPLWKKVTVAAAILAVVGIGILFTITKNNPPISYGQDIAPGGNKAFLVLGNGKRISLTDALQGQIAIENGIAISKATDGSLVYQASAQAFGKAVMNTFQTPNGGSSKVLLPDGTQVWLNAASSISYPSFFAAKGPRSVILKGEAYFEVAHDQSRPFIVKNAEQQVTVLGTHFNVNAYGDQGKVITTLLTGSVRVSTAMSEPEVIRPGQATVVTGKQIKVEQADLSEAVAWKNGEFTFTNQTLGQIMMSISRWYDVEVSFQDEGLRDIRFWGTVSRFEHISEVLRIMELTEKVHFEINGKKITISK